MDQIATCICVRPIYRHTDYRYDPEIGWLCEDCNAEMEVIEEDKEEAN